MKHDNAVSEIIGIILMVLIAIILSITVFAVVSHIGRLEQKNLHFLTFSQDKSEGKLTIVYVGISKPKWSDLIVQPDSVEIYDENSDGYVDVGEYLYNCTGKVVQVIDTKGKFLLGTWDFT